MKWSVARFICDGEASCFVRVPVYRGGALTDGNYLQCRDTLTDAASVWLRANKAAHRISLLMSV